MCRLNRGRGTQGTTGTKGLLPKASKTPPRSVVPSSPRRSVTSIRLRSRAHGIAPRRRRNSGRRDPSLTNPSMSVHRPTWRRCTLAFANPVGFTQSTPAGSRAPSRQRCGLSPRLRCPGLAVGIRNDRVS